MTSLRKTFATCLVGALALGLSGTALAGEPKPAAKAKGPAYPVVVIETSMGTIKVELYEDKAPITVKNFLSYVDKKHYDGTIFHRVIGNFMIQGGCPQGSGTGGPGYRFGDEFVSSLRHNKAGILSMANAGPGTNGSQFFITHGPTPHLDGKHSVFGEVIEGQNVVDSIRQGDRIGSVRIEGDVDAFLASPKVAAKVAEWNAVLDSRR